MDLLERVTRSTYLSGILAKNEDLAVFASGERAVDEQVLREPLQQLDRFASDQLEQTEACADQLRRIKQRFSLMWSLADLSGSLEFPVLSAMQSGFADRSIQLALEIVWRSQKIARLFANPEGKPASEAGMFILAAGKLGGWDLNFSSDVDLSAF